MKEIKLTQGKIALVDDADFDWLNSVRWHAFCSGGVWYAKTNIRRTSGKYDKVSMHALLAAIMGFRSPDHRDGNGLNNQRSNLRKATHQQNCCNRGRYSTNSSGFIGVHWAAHAHKWKAQAVEFDKRKHIGYFDTAEQAARARDAFVTKTYGEFVRLNFPNEATKI